MILVPKYPVLKAVAERPRSIVLLAVGWMTLLTFNEPDASKNACSAGVAVESYILRTFENVPVFVPLIVRATTADVVGAIVLLAELVGARDAAGADTRRRV